MFTKDNTIENLIELDGIRYVIDEHSGLWVKFDVKIIQPDPCRPHGIRYSLSLHNRLNQRIMGFDNAHAIKPERRGINPSSIAYDHWHVHGTRQAKLYAYKNAGKLIEDFWKAVEKALKNLEGEEYENH